MRNMLFQKNKKEVIKVVHYEGISEFNQDYPCSIEIKDTSFEIKKIKPEMVVTLPIEKIIKIDVLKEEEFMKKYHNTIGTNKLKYYLIITYNSNNQEKYIAFWGTAKEAMKFHDLKCKYTSSKNYTL